MPYELTVLVWGCLLALVHVLAPIHVKTKRFGRAWNMSARDEPMPDPGPLAGRLERAQANYFETFPVVVAIVLIDWAAGLLGTLTALGASLWIGARIVYLPLYATGVPRWRTLVWTVALVGIVLLLWPALIASY